MSTTTMMQLRNKDFPRRKRAAAGFFFFVNLLEDSMKEETGKR